MEVEVVSRSPKPPPEKVLRIWAREWFKERYEMDLGKLPKRAAFEKLARRWVAGGSQSAPSPGSATTGEWPTTTSGSARRAKLSSTRP